MRHRRGVQNTNAGADRLDFGEVGQRLRHHDAMRQHGAFGPAGGAAGVEQPGEIAGLARHDVDPVTLTKLPPFGAAGRDRTAVRCDIVGAIGTCQDERRFRVADNVTELLAMELGVHRHRDKPGVPDGE
jgi:hypothetical protein